MPADWRDAPNPQPVAGGPTQSDITGVLRERGDDAVIVERDGIAHRVAVDAISSIRLLSRRVVRNSEIREVERALMAAAPADERGEVDGWLLTSAGSALRSGVAAPVEFGSTAAGLPAALAWLAGRGLPRRIVVADRLLRTAALGESITESHDYEVLVGPVPEGPTPAGEWAPISDGVAAATVASTDGTARDEWRSLGFELHHTCRVLTL